MFPFMVLQTSLRVKCDHQTYRMHICLAKNVCIGPCGRIRLNQVLELGCKLRTGYQFQNCYIETNGSRTVKMADAGKVAVALSLLDELLDDTDDSEEEDVLVSCVSCAVVAEM